MSVNLSLNILKLEEVASVRTEFVPGQDEGPSGIFRGYKLEMDESPTWQGGTKLLPKTFA